MDIKIPVNAATAWARGCPKCRYGLLSTPPFATRESLFVERAIQARLGLVTFCDCHAGKCYYAHLRTVYAALQKNYNLEYLLDMVGGESTAPPMRYEPMEQTRVLEPVTAGGAAYAQ
jgi:hypothetical protein